MSWPVSPPHTFRWQRNNDFLLYELCWALDCLLVSIYRVPNEKYDGGSGCVKGAKQRGLASYGKEAEDRCFGERPCLEGGGGEVGLI